MEVTTIKTADSVSIELNDITKAILAKYKDVPFPGDKALPSYTNQAMNRSLKDLCEMAGINEPIRITTYRGNVRKDEVHPKWELVGTHTDLFRSTLLPAMVDAKEIKKDKRPIEVQMASLGLFYLPYNCPTNAGILLIGKNPTRFIPSASIQYVQFEGMTKGTKVLNERLFKNNLLTELHNLEQFAEFTLERKRPELVTGFRDTNFIGYPHNATRELLMNICQHRAYNGSNSPAHVYEYADRLEFDNTGNLYGKARPENFPTETDYRNPLISSVMRALGYVNRFGMGIGLVADELKSNGNLRPSTSSPSLPLLRLS